MTDSLKIAAFLDGRPGHEKQTHGILDALQAQTPIAVEYYNIPVLSFRAALKNWLLFAASVLNPLRKAPKTQFDLIIGTGSYTHIPALRLKQKAGGRVVTCMSPDKLLIGYMDLCFVPRHDKIKPAGNVFETNGPPSTIRQAGKQDPGQGLILIGGIDKRSHYWDSNSVAEKVEALISENRTIHWTISSSPRTPDDMCYLIDRMAQGAERISFLRFQETAPGWIETAYARSEMVWVTADSISMVYEALSAGCRVGIMPVQWRKKRSKFRTAETELIENGWAISYEDRIQKEKIQLKDVRFNEALRCAEEILRRWWPGRLP